MDVAVAVLIVLVASASAGLRRWRNRLAGDPVVPATGGVGDGTRRAAAALLAHLEAYPSGRPDPDRPQDDTVRVLVEVEPATLLVPFVDGDGTGPGTVQGSPVARGRLLVTNRELRFVGDQGLRVTWPVPRPADVAPVARGVLLPAVTPGGEVKGVGVDAAWVPLLPLVLAWAAAVHDDTSLAPVRDALDRLAHGGH